jgi:hypothetical protein
MFTLIVCLFQYFIYIQYKKKKTQQKYIINKTKKKMRKIKSLSILNENTYVLICWRLQEAKDYKKKMKIFAIEERKKDEMKRKRREMNWRGGRWDL